MRNGNGCSQARSEAAARHEAADILWVLETRRSVSPLAMKPPGPTTEELRRLLSVAARVPDHGMLVPWRFVVLRGDDQIRFAERLADAYRNANSTPDAEPVLARASRMKQAYAAPPVIVFVISRTNTSSAIPEHEQLLSAGAVCMNLLNAATAMGFSANWLTGWAATNTAARDLVGLDEGERIAGIVPLGSCDALPAERRRPDIDAITTHWRVKD